MRMSIKKATNLWRRVLKECYYTSDAARAFTVVGREFFPELLKEGYRPGVCVCGKGIFAMTDYCSLKCRNKVGRVAKKYADTEKYLLPSQRVGSVITEAYF